MPRSPRTVLDIPLSGGLKQKTADQWLPPGDQIQMQNVLWPQINVVGKRPGYLSESKTITYPAITGYTVGKIDFNWGATSLSNSAAFIPNGQGYAFSDGLYLYSESQSNQWNRWVDYVPPCVGIRRTIASSTNGAYFPSVAEYNGMRLYVWEDFVNYSGNFNNGIVYALVDAASNALIQQGTIGSGAPIGAGTSPRVLMMGSWAVVTYVDMSSGPPYLINAATLDLANIQSSTWTISGLVSDFGGNAYDVALATDFSSNSGHTTHICLTYTQKTIAGNNVALKCNTFSKLDSSTGFSNGQSLMLVSSSAIGDIDVVGTRWDAANGRIWYCYDCYDGTTNTVIGGEATTTFAPNVWTLTLHNSSTVYTAVQAQYGYLPCQIGVESIMGPMGVQSAMLLLQGLNIVHDGTSLAAQADSIVMWARIDTGAHVLGPFPTGQGLQLVSRPFKVACPDVTFGARVYAYCGSIEKQSSHFLMEFDVNGYSEQSGTTAITAAAWAQPRPCATFAPRLTVQNPAGLYMRRKSVLADVAQGTNTWTSAGIASQTNNAPSNMQVIGLTSDFAHPGISRSVQLGNISYIGGGVPSTFDGVSCVESGNLTGALSPYAFTGSATGGSLTNGKTYFYILVPEWRDAKGNVHQGQPSAPIQVAIPGGGTGTSGLAGLRAQYISATRKGDIFHRWVQNQSALYVIPYRTAFLNGAMTAQYYRTVGDSPGSQYLNAANDLSQDMFYGEGLGDFNISSNPFLYTTGGVLEADAPSSFADICQHNNRVYGIGDDLRTVWISTAQADGVPCYFNDGAQFEVPGIGDLTALWSMDSNLFVASATGLVYVQGGGPNIVGTQNDMSPPVSIPTDVGCADPRAVCVSSIGTVFRTASGLALLDRSLSIHSDFGDPVSALLAANPVTTSIRVHPTRPEIWVFCGTPKVGSSNSPGVALVFNYRYSAWSSVVVGDPDYTAQIQTCAASFTSNGNFFVANEYGRVYREKVSTDSKMYYDSVASSHLWVPMKIATSWIKPSGSLEGQGFVHNVEASFKVADWSNLKYSIAYDYSTSTTSPPSWNLVSQNIQSYADVVGVLGSVSRVSLMPANTRCSSFQITIQDQAPTTNPTATTGQSAQFLGLTSELEAMPGPHRVPSKQRG